MPLAFPSHQGLILPVLRWWPDRFDVLALCVGAAMPDVVDGLFGIYRGHLGHAFGHSLLGAVLLCWPAGLVLTGLISALNARLRQKPGMLGVIRAVLSRPVGWVGHRVSSGPHDRRGRFAIVSFSLIVGVLSHDLFDWISHDGFPWLYPWHADARWFPEWWYVPWFDVRLPFYAHPYPFAPHTVMWCALSVLGAVMYFVTPSRASSPSA